MFHVKHFFSFSVFLVILALIGLGTWQLQRRADKEAFLTTFTQNQKKPAQNVDAVTTPDPFVPLFAEGHFLPGKTIFLQAKTHQGKSGVYVLDVFQTQKGQFLLIQRGWSQTEIAAPPSGSRKVEGVVRIPALPNFFQPTNQPPIYFWIDLKALSHDLNLPLLPYYLVAKTPEDPRILPTTPIPLPSNHHLQYALTWYSLAFSLLIMLLWRKKQSLRKESL